MRPNPRRLQAEQERFMRLSLEQGELAVAAGEVPVGCVYVCRGAVVGTGFNATNAELDATRHAELVAADAMLLAQVGAPDSSPERRAEAVDFSACDLYVTCEPCIMCADALGHLGIRRVFFGCCNDRFGGCG